MDGIGKAALKSKAPQRRNPRQLYQRARDIVAGNRDLLRQDDPSKQDARDSQPQRFQEANDGQAFWLFKEGYIDSVRRYAGYRDTTPLPTYGYANRKYLYMNEVIPFYRRQWRKPPGVPRAYY